MFDEATFREILFPSSGNVNNYVAHIERSYSHMDGNKRPCSPREKEIAKCN